MRAIHVTEHGGPEALTLVELEVPEPDPSEVAVDVGSVGVNFADIKRRRGSSSRDRGPPFVPGIEAAGTVSATDSGTGFEVGDHVAVFPASGSYAEVVVVDADRVFAIPDCSDSRRPPPSRSQCSSSASGSTSRRRVPPTPTSRPVRATGRSFSPSDVRGVQLTGCPVHPGVCPSSQPSTVPNPTTRP